MTTLATAHEERIVSPKGVKIFVLDARLPAARLGTAPAGTAASVVARGSR